MLYINSECDVVEGNQYLVYKIGSAKAIQQKVQTKADLLRNKVV